MAWLRCRKLFFQFTRILKIMAGSIKSFILFLNFAINIKIDTQWCFGRKGMKKPFLPSYASP